MWMNSLSPVVFCLKTWIAADGVTEGFSLPETNKFLNQICPDEPSGQFGFFIFFWR